jgi:polysaccharide biosynthesis/export protein
MKSACLLLLAGALGTSWAQVPIAAPNLPVHRIGPNDLISISIFGEPDLSRTVRVGSDGAIRLPLVRQRVKADGLMPEELDQAIGKAFEAEQILINPWVTVTVSEYHTLLPVSVAGAVRNPVTFEPNGKMTLLEAITRAGGLLPEAGPEILVTRSAREPVQHIPVHALIDAADPSVNLALQGGEEIRVPEAGKIFVVGNAIALTEGLAPYASNEAYIYRRDASGSPNQIPVDLGRIMQRKSPDVPLLANDIFYIPDRSGKRLALSVLEKVVLFGAGISTAFIYMAH